MTSPPPGFRSIHTPTTLDPAALGAAHAVLRAAAETVAPPAWLVGGAVRDGLRGAAIHDLDLALPGGSLDAARRLADRLGAAFVPIGEPHGVARVILRAPVALTVDLADLRGPTLEADLAARDVTVDALATPLHDLVQGPSPVIDPMGGVADLGARRLRACHPGAFTDDPVRIWRLLRLRHELGFAVDPVTEALARAATPTLAGAAAERVRDELTRILLLPSAAGAIRDAEAWGVLASLLPEIAVMRATTQSAPHRFTVWEHSARALEAVEALLADLALLAPHDARVAGHLAAPLGAGLTRRGVLKVAVLLHDVAKPATRSVDPDGRVRFTGHDRLGAARAAAFAVRLRWPGAARAVLERLVGQHLRPMHLGLLRTITPRARYRFFRDLGDEVPDLVCLTVADAAATDGRPPAQVYRGATRALLDSFLAGQVEAAREAETPPLLRGDDVMAALGLSPGPEIGRLLRAVREAQALGVVTSRAEALGWLERRRGST